MLSVCSWVKRYFEHSSHYLKYYDNDKMKELKGAMDLYLVSKVDYDEAGGMLTITMEGESGIEAENQVLKLKAESDTAEAKEKLREWVTRVQLYEPEAEDDDEDDGSADGGEADVIDDGGEAVDGDDGAEDKDSGAGGDEDDGDGKGD